MKKIKQHFIETTIALSLFAFIFFSNPSQTRAQSPGSASAPTPAPKSETKVTSSDKYTVLAPLPCIESAGIECEGGNGAVQKEVDFKTYVQYTINLLIALSAATAVVMIVWGGIEYMWSNSYSDKTMGLQKAKNAVIGLLLVLTSYIILRTIDPRLVEIPNTLVPQLTVEEWLTAENSLLRSLEDDAKAYDLKRREIGLEMQQIRNKKDSLEKQISDIEQKIENEKKKNPGPDNKELASLEKELAKMMEEEKDLGSAYQVNKVESELNGILDESKQIFDEGSDLLQLNQQYTGFENIDSLTKNKIDRLMAKKNLVDKAIFEAGSQLSSMGNYDNKILRDQKLYSKTMVDSYILLLSANTIRSSTEPNTNRSLFYATLPTGELKTTYDKSEIKKVLQENLDSINKFTNAIGDTELKTKLKERAIKIESLLTEKLP